MAPNTRYPVSLCEAAVRPRALTLTSSPFGRMATKVRFFDNRFFLLMWLPVGHLPGGTLPPFEVCQPLIGEPQLVLQRVLRH